MNYKHLMQNKNRVDDIAGSIVALGKGFTSLQVMVKSKEDDSDEKL